MVTMTNEAVYRGLTYVAMLNEGGAYPSKGEVNAFVATPLPRTTLDAYLGDRLSLSAIVDREIAQYLLRTGLIEDGDGADELALTNNGAAFLASLQKREQGDPTGASVLEVVGRFDDPVTYSKMLTEIDKQTDAIVIDPYLPASDLITLLELPSVSRVLTKDTAIKGQKQDERRRHLAIALGARPEVELRFLPPQLKELHDRYVLSAQGEGIMFGTSLGGTQVTVITHLSADTAEVLRTHYDELWNQGVPLAPIERAKIADRKAVEAPTKGAAEGSKSRSSPRR